MHKGRVEAWSAHRRLRMMNPHGSGSSACQSLAADPELRVGCERFLQTVGWTGPFMMEFLRAADGTPWFMELNGRPWGSMALARRQGLEYPAWAVAAALDDRFTPPVPPAPTRPLTVRHLGRDLLHLLFVLKGPRTAFHRQTWPRLLPALAAVLRPARARSFYNHDPAYPGYVLRDAVATVRKALGHAKD